MFGTRGGRSENPVTDLHPCLPWNETRHTSMHCQMPFKSDGIYLTKPAARSIGHTGRWVCSIQREDEEGLTTSELVIFSVSSTTYPLR